MNLHSTAVWIAQNPSIGDPRKSEAESQAPGFLSLRGRVDLEDRPVGELGRVVAWSGAVLLGLKVHPEGGIEVTTFLNTGGVDHKQVRPHQTSVEQRRSRLLSDHYQVSWQSRSLWSGVLPKPWPRTWKTRIPRLLAWGNGGGRYRD
jgi:hypothetical protein